MYVDDIKVAGKKQNIDPMWKELMRDVDLGEPTSFFDHVYLGRTQRECETSKDIVDNERSMFESRIAAGAMEKLSEARRDSRDGPGIPESISTSKFHFVPRASIVSRRLHCSPGGFLRTDALIHLFVSLAARIRGRESKQILIHQTCAKVIHMEFQANIEMGFCRRVAL